MKTIRDFLFGLLFCAAIVPLFLFVLVFAFPVYFAGGTHPIVVLERALEKWANVLGVAYRRSL